MKRSHGARFWITCIGALWAFIAAPLVLQAQGNGVVAGRVFDVAGNGVTGVEVSVVDTNLTVTTAERGAFRFGAVPVGTQTLLFVYLGFGAQTLVVFL